MRLGIRALAALGICGAAVAAGTLAPSGAGAAASPLTKLTASIHFTAASYRPGARATIVITLRNTGSTTLTGITAECNRAGSPGEIGNAGKAWGALALTGHGVTVAAHRTVTTDVVATVPAAAQRFGAVVVACGFGHRNVDSGYRPQARATAKVPGMAGAVTAQVGHPVAGRPGVVQGLKDARVVLVDATRCPVLSLSAVSDAKGLVHFKVPAGWNYQVYVFPPHGWKVTFPNPTTAQVVGRETAQLSLGVTPGYAHLPVVPTKCR